MTTTCAECGMADRPLLYRGPNGDVCSEGCGERASAAAFSRKFWARPVADVACGGCDGGGCDGTGRTTVCKCSHEDDCSGAEKAYAGPFAGLWVHVCHDCDGIGLAASPEPLLHVCPCDGTHCDR